MSPSRAVCVLRPDGSIATRFPAASCPTCVRKRPLSTGDRFEIVEDLYAAANQNLGRIIKVTPSSKVVGDLALYLAGVDADPAEFERNPAAFDLPDSVIGFLEGELGVPQAVGPNPFEPKALEGRAVVAKPVVLANRTKRR